MLDKGKIGLFDSGYGGLTILKGIRSLMPEYDYIYLGDNARAPYGSRSFDIVYQFTLEAVQKLFDLGCNLIVLACNTASAKALRSIQQNDLPVIDPEKRVLGVIRPTVEAIGDITGSGHVGLLATPGTVNSRSYNLEVEKLYGDNIRISELACPMWVPIVENGEADGDGADWFVKKYLSQILSHDPEIDTILLGCTHYPILLPKIRKYCPGNIRIVAQGQLVAESLKNYLQRHPDMEKSIARNGSLKFYTTENPGKFNSLASLFLDSPVRSHRLDLAH